MAKTIGPTTGYVRNKMQTVTRIQQNCFYHHWTHRREGVTLQFLKFPLFWYFWKNSTPLLIITPSCFVFRVHISEGKIIKTKLLMLNSFFSVNIEGQILLYKHSQNDIQGTICTVDQKIRAIKLLLRITLRITFYFDLPF